MPELPEVETIARGLAPELEGRTVTGVTVREARLRTPVARDFAARLRGRTLGRMGRTGKYLVTPLDDGARWLVHLGMTGRLTIGGAHRLPLLHDHVELRFDDGRTLVYNDPRRFGRLDVLDAAALAKVVGPGIDALDATLTGDWLFARARGRRTSVKALLMDQREIAGLGNIYVSEALHVARLSPFRRASTIATRSGEPREAAYRLTEAIKQVLTKAINRESAPYRSSRFRVYDREGEPCPRRGCGGIIKRRTQGGRSTFYCPVCQR